MAMLGIFMAWYYLYHLAVEASGEFTANKLLGCLFISTVLLSSCLTYLIATGFVNIKLQVPSLAKCRLLLQITILAVWTITVCTYTVKAINYLGA